MKSEDKGLKSAFTSFTYLVSSPRASATSSMTSSTTMSTLSESRPSIRFLLQNGQQLERISASVATASLTLDSATPRARSGIPAFTPPPAPQQRWNSFTLSISTNLTPGMCESTYLGASKTPTWRPRWQGSW